MTKGMKSTVKSKFLKLQQSKTEHTNKKRTLKNEKSDILSIFRTNTGSCVLL